MKVDITDAMTVDAAADRWLTMLRAQGRLENSTINEYDRVLRRTVLPKLGSASLLDLTTDQINAVLEDLGTQSVNRQRKAKVVTGAMLDVAVACGALASNPMRGSISVRRPKTRVEPLSPSQVECIRTAVQTWASKTRPGPRASDDMADIVDVMFGTGARIGEVLALRWRDIDIELKRLRIAATIKTETGPGTYRKQLAVARDIELPDFATAVLRRRHSRTCNVTLDAVFTTRNGTWHQVNNVERRWRQIRKDAGLDWVTPELFRHSAMREV